MGSDHNHTVYNPSCALQLYKPGLAEKVHAFLNQGGAKIPLHAVCCHYDPGLPDGSVIINTCPGCDRRFDNSYENVSTVSIWEIIAEHEDFSFPDYNGMTLSVHDPCPFRKKPQVHDAVRLLLNKMNIKVIESEQTREKSVCCGFGSYPKDGADPILIKARQRAEKMPVDDVCVYCVSCIKAIKAGGKQPRYLLDLLFSEATDPGDCDPVKWHDNLNRFITRNKI